MFDQFKKKREFDPNSLEDEPIPTYKEWLDEGAEHVFSHPACFVAKGAISLIKYLWTREQLMLQLLQQKGILAEHEVEEHFGQKAHEECAKQGTKSLTRTMLSAASQGKMIGPTGESIDPDTVLVVLNDILDLNDTGWNGRTLEIIYDMFAEKDENTLRKDYEREVELLSTLNEKRARIRGEQERRAEQQRELKERLTEERVRKVKIYLSKCRVHDMPLPTEEEQQKMREGEIPIPKVA